MNDKVSILIPTYNRKNFIKEAIESCLEQTHKNFEIIIYDDGSTDGTKSLVKNYIDKHGNKIKYIREDNNKGTGYARNRLLKEMSGNYGCWLDSDDFMNPLRLKRCLIEMEKGEYDILYSYIRRFSGNKSDPNIMDRIKIDPSKYDKKVFKSLNANTACATGFFKSKLSKYPFAKNITMGGEDVLWIWSLLQNDVKIGYIREDLYYYRQHSERIGIMKRSGHHKKIKVREEGLLKSHINKISKHKRI